MPGEKEGAPTPQPSDAQHDTREYVLSEAREYTLSEVSKAAIWAELARLTPALSKPAAAVLTWLTNEALRNGATSLRASCRDVEAGTGWSRPSTIKAMRALVAMGVIAKRAGTATRPAAYLLRYAETLRMGGKAALPPVQKEADFPQEEWSTRLTRVVKPVDHQTSQNPSLFDMAPGVLSIDQSSSSLTAEEKASFDRSSDFFHTDAQRNECRALMVGFAKHRCRIQSPHTPDKKMLEMMLRVAEWERLRPWLLWMTGVSKTQCGIVGKPPDPPRDLGNAYAWLLKVAINNLLGIDPAEQQPTLELLRGGKQQYTRWHSEGLK